VYLKCEQINLFRDTCEAGLRAIVIRSHQ